MSSTRPQLVVRRPATRGGTLIVGLVVASGLVFEANATSSRVDTALNEIAYLVQSVELYQLQKAGECPNTVQDLQAAGVIKKTNPDPWGNEYVIKCPGEHDAVDVSSPGSDGELGTEDDINSWDPPDKARSVVEAKKGCRA